MKDDSRGFKNKYDFKPVIKHYSNSVEDVGLWYSERVIFDEYLDRDMNILDLGCGAGRVTFNMYDLGFTNISGLDVSKGMIAAARKKAKTDEYPIEFLRKDARDMPFENGEFDGVIFSFNGLMTIEKRENRAMVLSEISRVLKPGGILIFTTHDIENESYDSFWTREKNRWDNGAQDERLHEFGDTIVYFDSHDGDAAVFLHIPEYKEIKEETGKVGLEIIRHNKRQDISTENIITTEFSDECVFWVCRKQS